MPAKHIGIVACSAEGASLCYRTICVEGAKLLGAHEHPEVSVHTHSLAQYLRFLERRDWRAVAELMDCFGKQARDNRRRVPDLSGQHDSPCAAFRPASIAVALAAHRRDCRHRSQKAGIPARGNNRNPVAGRKRIVSGEAERMRARILAANRSRASGNQPHHYG